MGLASSLAFPFLGLITFLRGNITDGARVFKVGRRKGFTILPWEGEKQKARENEIQN